MIEAGERVILHTPGGAGYGYAKDRDRAKVAADVADGLVTVETARTVYGFDAT